MVCVRETERVAQMYFLWYGEASVMKNAALSRSVNANSMSTQYISEMKTHLCLATKYASNNNVLFASNIPLRASAAKTNTSRGLSAIQSRYVCGICPELPMLHDWAGDSGQD